MNSEREVTGWKGEDKHISSLILGGKYKLFFTYYLSIPPQNVL